MMYTFKGPLFIVGVPRSGTALLRALVNSHPEVRISPHESHFIPFFIKKYGSTVNLSESLLQEVFLRDFYKTPYYRAMIKSGYSFNEAEFRELLSKSTSWEPIFRFLLVEFPYGLDKNNKIWGDKTPGYLKHVSLLMNTFPDARFVHILRDPRDISLSVSKTWKKSMLRSAEQWRMMLEKLDTDKLRNNYLLIKYSQLLQKTEVELRNICQFIGVDFYPDMIELQNAVGNLGSTEGKRYIVKNNINKYKTNLSPRKLRRIEEIAYPMLRKFDFQIESAIKYKPFNKWEKLYFMLYDSIALTVFNIRRRGILNGIKYLYREVLINKSISILKRNSS